MLRVVLKSSVLESVGVECGMLKSRGLDWVWVSTTALIEHHGRGACGV